MSSKFFMPPLSLIGKGCLHDAGPQLKALGLNKALIVTDKMLIETGLVNNLTSVLENNDLNYAIYDGVKPMQESSINSNGEKISPILFKSLKDRIELSWKIQSHIEEFLPIEYNKDPVLEDATKNIRD